MVEDDQRATGPDPGIRRVCVIVPFGVHQGAAGTAPCRCGADTSAIRSSLGTAPAGSTSRCSWWRRSPTTRSCRRRPRSSDVGRRRRARTATA